jgi:amidase
MIDEPCRASACDLARAIRSRRISSSELLDVLLVRVSDRNAELNAIVTVDAEQARSRAREADDALARGQCWGALHGVPVTIKDAFCTAGLRTTSGFSPLAGFVPEEDATVVARLRAAGAVVLGKTNLPELAGDFQSDNQVFGRSNNPWDPARTPGGSTGGGAAAVAACLSPLEIGSDGAGSLRIPAQWCGVYTIKPTEHRVPGTGHIPGLPGMPRGVRHQGCPGPIARSIEDLALALRLIAGPDAQDWEVPPAPLLPPPPRSLSTLRIAWTEDFGTLPLDSEMRAAIRRFVGDLDRAGCRIESRAPAHFDLEAAWEAWSLLFTIEIGSAMPPGVIEAYASDPKVASDPCIRRGVERAGSGSMAEFAGALATRDVLIGSLEALLTDWDVLLCPVTPTPAIAHCAPGTPVRVGDRELPYWTGCSGFTNPFNLTGHPVVVLPIALSTSGLPIGVQLVGRRWGEMDLLAVAEQLDLLAPRLGAPPRC